MMTVKNPYFSAGGLAEDTAIFYGRVDELRQIRDRWREGKSTAVFGLPGIGKSSLLYQLVQQADRLPTGTIAMYLNLQGLALQGPLGVLNVALQGFEECLASHAYHFPSLARMEDFADHMDRLVSDGYRPALCLDGVDAVSPKQGFDPRFFETLYTLGTRHSVRFVTASQRPLTVTLQRGGNPLSFCELFTPLELAGIREMWAATLLIKPFRMAKGYSPSLDDCRYALSLSGRYPFYMQMVAHHLFEIYVQGEPLDRPTLRDAFVQTATPHLEALWEALTSEQREAVLQCLDQGEDLAPEDQRILLHAGLVQKAPRGLRLFSDIFADGLQSGALLSPKRDLASWPIYTYIAVVMVCAIVVASVVSLALPEEQFWPFFVIPTLLLGAILILVDQWTERRFLAGLARLLGEGG
jgi:hypothetical protein